MVWITLFPISIGAMSVLQAVLNRRIAGAYGLSGAVLLNAVVMTLAALALYVVSVRAPHLFPPLFRPTGAARSAWWFVLPGLFGLAIVVGLPVAIDRIGAAPVFVLMIGAQIATSLLWDVAVEGLPLGTSKVVGAVLAVVGAVLTVRR